MAAVASPTHTDIGLTHCTYYILCTHSTYTQHNTHTHTHTHTHARTAPTHNTHTHTHTHTQHLHTTHVQHLHTCSNFCNVLIQRIIIIMTMHACSERKIRHVRFGLSEWNVQSHTHHTHSHTHPPPTQYEAIPESLKNMLLVMSTQGIFDIVHSSQSDPSIHLSAKDAISQLLWQQTQERVEKFLPNLLRDLFPGLASLKKATPTKEVTVATVAVAVPSPAGSPIRSTSASPLSTSPGEWALVCIM